MALRLAAEARQKGLGDLVRARQDLDDQSIANADESVKLVSYHGDDWMDRTAAVEGQRYRIDTAIAGLDARLHAEFPDYFRLTGTEALTLRQAQAMLKPDEAILLVVQSPAGAQVMAVSRSAIKWQRTSWNGGRVTAAVRRLLWDVGAHIAVDKVTSARWEKEEGPGYPFDRKTAFGLYQQLVAPVGDVLAGKRHVFIAAGGALSSFPFGILVTAPPQGADRDPRALRATRWFADDHALITIPSVQALQYLRSAPARADAGPISFAGYGDPSLGGMAEQRGIRHQAARKTRSMAATGENEMLTRMVDEIRSLPSLPGTATELENMRRVLGAPASAVHIQQQATERAVRSADLSGIRILAFATHGVMAGELPGSSEPGLIFTPPEQASADDDGFLTASEVSTMKLDADWVILSACNTAAGDGSQGAPGLSGLARAFLYAGAHNLLVSHWPVRDDVASRITVDAIRRQRGDPALSRAEAFQQAMRAIRNDATHDSATDSWAHPNAWAPFALIGDGAR
jgi:CHAT domain-containing protein